MYGSPTPPPYNLTQVTAKTFIFIGEADDIATWPDANHLAKLLPNVAKIELLKFPGHLNIFPMGLGQLVGGSTGPE